MSFTTNSAKTAGRASNDKVVYQYIVVIDECFNHQTELDVRGR